MKGQLALLGAIILSCGTTGSYVYATTEPLSLIQSNSVVRGHVVDENGDPVIGASISEEGTTRGTVTDVNGSFTLNVAQGAKLKIVFLGYKTVLRSASADMNIQLVADNALLDEVVVVGYGQQKKVNLTGAVANVDLDKTLSSRPEKDVAKALQGAVPGLTIVNSNGDINGQPSIRIRGVGTLSNSQNSSPLIIVDGVPTDDLTMINGSDIATVSVLKDAASSSIYGSRAAFGVLLITTKQANKGDKVSIKYDNNFGWSQATYLPDYPDVPTQLTAAMIAKNRAGQASVELFGMYFDQLLPYAQKWQQQNSGKKGYTVMRPYVDDNNVGDYLFLKGQPMYYADYDIQKIWYNNAAPSQSHNFSVSGSSGKTTYYTNFGYNQRQDLMTYNEGTRNRYNLTVNLSSDVTDWLTIGTRVNFSRKNMRQANPYNYIYQYIWRWGSFFIPSGIMQTADGKEYDYRVVAMQKQASRSTDIHDVLRMNAFAKAHLTKELTLNVDYTYQINNFNYSSSNNSVYGMNWSGTTPGYIVQPTTTNVYAQNIKMNRWTVNAYANYARTWNDVHNLNVMAGINGENYTSDMFSAKRTQLYDESYPELALAYGDMAKATIASSAGDRASAGYFGRINYDYKGIYLLELNGRYDGSSRFPTGSKWAFFPSGSLGYRFTEEPYWKDLHKYVSNGKIRASYGEIGNEAVGDNMFLSTISPYAQTSLTWLDGKASRMNQFGLPSWVASTLTWERIKTTDIGIDLSFLNDELTLSADVYQRTNNDMLAPGNALPTAIGASAPYINAGKLRTRGWEMSLAWHKQFTNELGLYANFNIGDSKSKVTQWNNTSRLIGHTEVRSYAYEGETWGDIWGFETDRYFTENDFSGKNADGSWNYKQGVASQVGIQTNNFIYGPGDIKFKDLDGSGVIDGGKGTAEDHGDLKVIGNTLPRYEYSFRVGGAYKGFDLDLFFQGVGKRDMWTISSFVFPEMRDADVAIYANQTKYNVYDPANGNVNISESNDFPVLYSGNETAGNVPALAAYGGSHNYYPQSKYLVNMAYLRLKNVTLGYSLPKALMRKIYIQKVRLYVSGDNLCLLYKGSKNLPIDPEMNDSQGGLGNGTWGRTFPMMRTLSFGIQVTL